MPQHFDRIDEDSLGVLVRAFYGSARSEPWLGPVFEAAVDDWEAHFGLLTRFWSSVMLGSRSFRGDPVSAHRRHPIAPEMFPRWLAIWGETVDGLFTAEPAAALKAKAAQIGESLQLALFFRPA